MRDLERFRREVRARLGALGRSQQELARAIGLHPAVLSHKLRGRDGATLTQADGVGLVRTLAGWGALSTRAEARALLALLAVPPHALAPDAAAWAAPPLAALAPDAAAPAGLSAAPAALAALAAPVSPPGVSALPPARLALAPRPLPAPLAPLIGRAGERTAVHAALAASRLVTLTGVGGVGKTRLAVQVAREAADGGCFPDGVAFVDLSPLRDPALLASALLHALGLAEQPAAAPEDHLVAALQSPTLLLVADNLEHLLEGAPLLGRLLAAAPRLRVLATSRVPLRLYGEQEIRVPPLALPAPSPLRTGGAVPATDSAGGAGEPDDPAGSEAVRLFVARARAVAPGFAPSGTTLAAVAAICAALDGLPLAIELAAARVKLFPPEALLPRLRARLTVLTDLTGGPRDRPERQRTMRAALDWSYALLSPAEQALLTRLGVFAGSFAAAAAVAVCVPDDVGDTGDAGEEARTPGDPPGPDADAAGDRMLARLAALAEQSLVEVAPGPTPRFRLLETVRAYALARLAEAGAQEASRDRHLRYYRALAEGIGEALMGPEQGAWVARLEEEHDNLRVALAWARERGAAAEGLRLAAALGRFWALHGHFREGQGWLEAALAGGGDPGTERARALNSAGSLARRQGDYARAASLLEEALALWRALGDTRGSAGALGNLGLVAHARGEYARAAALHEEALALWRALGDTRGVSVALGNLGRVALRQGDEARALALLEETLRLKHRVGDTRGSAGTLTSLGRIAARRGEYARATGLLEESLALKGALGDRLGRATALGQLGWVAFLQGDGARAVALLGESLWLGHDIGARDRTAEALESLAAVVVAGGQPREGALLAGAATALRAALGLPLAPDQQAGHERMIQAARDALGADTFMAAWAEGTAWEPERAVSAALALTPTEALHPGF